LQLARDPVNDAPAQLGRMLLKLGGDIAQEGVPILRRKRLGAIHHDVKFVIAERSTG
jgi:hypothetical protein